MIYLSNILYALAATTVTWLFTAIGAAAVFIYKRADAQSSRLLLGFAAGVMISASFWSLLNPAVERARLSGMTAPWLIATAGFLSGAGFMYAMDCLSGYLRRKRHSSEKQRSRASLMVLSITLHNIPEGLAVGVAFGALGASFDAEALTGATVLALGIAVQNFPEGAAVSLPLRREGISRPKSFLIGQASGMVEPLAGVIGAAAVSAVSSLLPFALSFAAGAMIVVAVHELIPECESDGSRSPYLGTMGIVLGFSLMMLLDVALG